MQNSVACSHLKRVDPVEGACDWDLRILSENPLTAHAAAPNQSPLLAQTSWTTNKTCPTRFSLLNKATCQIVGEEDQMTKER